MGIHWKNLFYSPLKFYNFLRKQKESEETPASRWMRMASSLCFV